MLLLISVLVHYPFFRSPEGNNKMQVSAIRMISGIVALLISIPMSFGDDPKGDRSYRAMTYNIRYANTGDKQDQWLNRKEAVVRTILASDIVGLQEVLSVQQEYIQSQSPGWQWWAMGRDDGKRRGEMCSIGWKADKFTAVEQGTFWLSRSPFRIGQPGWDAALPRIASWVRLIPNELGKESHSTNTGESTSLNNNQVDETISLLVINTHFDHQGHEARRQSAALLRRWIAQHRGKSDAILMGDFNAQLDSPPLNELLSADVLEYPVLVDARDRSPSPDTGPDSTWNGFQEIAPGRRIDHILIQGQGITIKTYETLNPKTADHRFASDHLPVTIMFGLSESVAN